MVHADLDAIPERVERPAQSLPGRTPGVVSGGYAGSLCLSGSVHLGTFLAHLMDVRRLFTDDGIGPRSACGGIQAVVAGGARDLVVVCKVTTASI